MAAINGPGWIGTAREGPSYPARIKHKDNPRHISRGIYQTINTNQVIEIKSKLRSIETYIALVFLFIFSFIETYCDNHKKRKRKIKTDHDLIMVPSIIIIINFIMIMTMITARGQVGAGSAVRIIKRIKQARDPNQKNHSRHHNHNHFHLMEFIVAALHDCNKLPSNILFVIFQKYVPFIHCLWMILWKWSWWL